MKTSEAIASLKTLCNTCTMFPKCVNNKPECFQAIEMAISALEKQEADRWIPVTKIPPEDGERVLITYNKNVIRATWDEMRGYFYDTSAMALDKEFVSAWKPLPEPYTEEEA